MKISQMANNENLKIPAEGETDGRKGALQLSPRK